ncbi:hypothetical protein BC830DRAFT_1089514 [Chytriomyces sp. MP71]|nr:hypothetical protein BC830DRAFT_1089514 [Chytriomyces sp. MP71]
MSLSLLVDAQSPTASSVASSIRPTKRFKGAGGVTLIDESEDTKAVNEDYDADTLPSSPSSNSASPAQRRSRSRSPVRVTRWDEQVSSVLALHSVWAVVSAPRSGVEDLCVSGQDGVESQGVEPNSVGEKKARMLQCTWTGCSKTFKNASHLNSHMQGHAKIKSHECHLCPLAFTRKHDLARHVRSVHEARAGIASMVCKVCQKTYGRSDSFKRHLGICKPAASDSTALAPNIPVAQTLPPHLTKPTGVPPSAESV